MTTTGSAQLQKRGLELSHMQRRMRRNDVEREAANLIAKYGVTRPPVPVDEIARMLGAEVRYSPGNDNVSGALVRSPQGIVIGVNSAQHFHRQRFTIAHELAHFLLHDGIQLHVDAD